MKLRKQRPNQVRIKAAANRNGGRATLAISHRRNPTLAHKIDDRQPNRSVGLMAQPFGHLKQPKALLQRNRIRLHRRANHRHRKQWLSWLDASTSWCQNQVRLVCHPPAPIPTSMANCKSNFHHIFFFSLHNNDRIIQFTFNIYVIVAGAGT